MFSYWINWTHRNELENISFPGVYCIAVSKVNISNLKFSYLKCIQYIGMTNSIKGLKGRLKQFDNTIKGKRGHGGADRFRYEYEEYNELIKNLYVSIQPFICDVKSNNPNDLEVMGEVAKQEYLCIAEYVRLFNALPHFNDKKNAPKYSLTKGKIV